MVQKAISLGVAKVNVNTECQLAFADATRKYSKTNTANISNCCKGKRNYCGTLEDGRKMHWKYYEDYIKELESTAS